MKKIIYLPIVIILILIIIFTYSKSSDSNIDLRIQEGNPTFINEEILGSNLPDGNAPCKSVYKNVKYGYQIDCPSDFIIYYEITDYSDEFSIFSEKDNKKINIYGDNWETAISIIGTGIDVGQLYLDDLKIFSKKIWEVQAMDRSNKTIETVTELVQTTFAGTIAYRFTQEIKYPPHIEGGSGEKIDFIILEHLGKKIIISYTSDDLITESIIKSFRLNK